MKTQPWAIFARVRTAHQHMQQEYITGCNHDDSLEDDYCVSFFNLKFLIPTLRHIIYSPTLSDIEGECDFVSSVSGNKLGEYTFLWF